MLVSGLGLVFVAIGILVLVETHIGIGEPGWYRRLSPALSGIAVGVYFLRAAITGRDEPIVPD